MPFCYSLPIDSLGLKRTLIVLVFVALLITATDQLANFFKYGVARLRPCHDEEINMLAKIGKKIMWREVRLFFCTRVQQYGSSFIFYRNAEA